MFFLKKLLAAAILPPCGPVLLAALGLLLLRWRRKLAQCLMAFGLAALLILSLPVVSCALLRTLEPYPPLPASALSQAQAMVVLGGGTYYEAPEYGGDTVSSPTLERLRYAARLYRRAPLPILVTGGAPFGGRPEADSMRLALQDDFGIPVRWVETSSRDTAENAAFSAPLLKNAGISRIVLLSHAWHLPRAKALFEARGLIVLPAPTGYTTMPPSLAEALLPSGKALNDSRRAINEWLGRLVGAA